VDARRDRWSAVIWAAIVAALLLVPLPDLFAGLAREVPGGLPLDKLVHVALFVLLARSWLLAASRAGRWWTTLAVALAAVAYGALLELLQGLGGVRAAELLDLVADALGVVLALLLHAHSSARSG